MTFSYFQEMHQKIVSFLYKIIPASYNIQLNPELFVLLSYSNFSPWSLEPPLWMNSYNLPPFIRISGIQLYLLYGKKTQKTNKKKTILYSLRTLQNEGNVLQAIFMKRNGNKIRSYLCKTTFTVDVFSRLEFLMRIWPWNFQCRHILR